MNKKRKLEVDSDLEEFNPKYYFNESANSPQSITFERYDLVDSKHLIPSKQALPFRNLDTNVQSNAKINADLKKSHSAYASNIPRQRDSGNYCSKLDIEKSENSNDVLEHQIKQMQTKAAKQKKDHSCKNIFQKNNILGAIVKSQKIKNIQRNFIRKIGRTSTARQPVTFTLFSHEEMESILDYKGFELPSLADNLLNLLSIILIFFLLVVYSISIVFNDLINQSHILARIQIASLFFYLIEITINFTSIKFDAGKRIQIFKEIWLFYISKNFWIDVASFLILLLDITSSIRVVSYFRLFIIFKLPQCFSKIEKLQAYFVKNIYNEQYWQLAKVFLFNFCYAHIIALLLAGMSNLESENWMTIKGIDSSGWVNQYIWAYYWAVNIMLTVGFGDIFATNSTQALCLIFIETFSCIVMAYNVNCMGAIISKIRAEDQIRSRKFKIFKKLTSKNYVPPQLNYKINNYIQESSNLKKMFNYQEDKEFLNDLPQELKISYLRAANQEVMKKLVFFRQLLDKSLFSLAEHLESRISHPQEIIKSIDDDFNLIILKKGEIGYICKKSGCEFNDEIADLIKVKSSDDPFLTSLDFLTKTRTQYEIKSLTFSELLFMNYSSLIDIFKTNEMDYQLYCFLRDKIRNIPDQFQVLPCVHCELKFNHFKFTCPRLHYAPFEQHIIHKELNREKMGKNERKTHDRVKNEMLTPSEYYKKIRVYQSEDRPQPSQVKCKRIRNEKLKTIDNNAPSTQKQSFALPLNGQSLGLMISNLFQTKTREIIQMQFLRDQNKQQFDDDVWTLCVDRLMDYNSYFPSNNPDLIGKRFSNEDKTNKMIENSEIARRYETLRKTNKVLASSLAIINNNNSSSDVAEL